MIDPRRHAAASGLAALATVALLVAAALSAIKSNSAWAEDFVVAELEVADLKAVFATVRSKDRTDARVRTPGTVVDLKVEEGAHVEPGQVLALVADPKLALQIKSLDAQIVGLESRFVTAKRDYERGQQLAQRGVLPKARIDQLKTAFDVASNDLKSVRAERLITEQQVSEGQVLAPAGGRVLRVPVTEGSVVMAGESIATIAANEYLLRLELPERHARFIQDGDPVQLGARGLADHQKVVSKGRIVQVYPELQNGRVLADAAVEGLGDYFVGERVLVWIAAGTRKTIVVPQSYVFTRFGLDFVRLEDGKATADVVVQPGQVVQTDERMPEIEILAGLKPGDRLVKPEVRAGVQPEVKPEVKQ